MNHHQLNILTLAILPIILSRGAADLQSALRVDYSWKYIDFTFPTPEARQEAIDSGAYNYTQVLPLGADIWRKKDKLKVFIAMPRGLSSGGVPVTLATVSEQKDPNNPESRLLAPYPDWSWHRNITDTSECGTVMSSVYRVAIDALDRLWVLDSAEVGICKPKLFVFDLNTDTLSELHDLSQASTSGSYLILPIVDLRQNGRNVFVYNADSAESTLVVYDAQTKSAWRVKHPSLKAESNYSKIEVAGTTFEQPDALFGMALGPLQARCAWPRFSCRTERTLYYHALASLSESYVDTSALRNQNNFPPNGGNEVPFAFRTFRKTRSSQSAAEVMTDSGVLFSGLLSDLSITCWNSNKSPFPGPGGHLQVVARNAETLQFPSDLKVRYGRLVTLTCRYQLFKTGTMDWSKVNYRVLSGDVDDLIRGTQCEF